jgi:hypothetical protein
MSALFQLIMQPSIAPLSNNSSYIVQRIAFCVYNSSYWLGLCTEEISLGLLVRDFRKLLKQQFRTIFPCCGKSAVGHTTASPTTSLPQRQTTNAVAVVKNPNNVRRVTNAIGSQQQQQQRR